MEVKMGDVVEVDDGSQEGSVSLKSKERRWDVPHLDDNTGKLYFYTKGLIASVNYGRDLKKIPKELEASSNIICAAPKPKSSGKELA